MQIERRFKPWISTLQDDSSPVLCCAFVNRTGSETGVLVSANGFLMTILPVVLTPDEPDGLIHRKLMQYAWTVTSRKRGALVTLMFDGEWIVMPDESRHRNHFHGSQYPNWQRIVPPWKTVATVDARRAAISVNLRLLYQIAQAMDVREPMRLGFTPGMNTSKPVAGPILVSETPFSRNPTPPYAIVMPVYMSDEAEMQAGRGIAASAVA